MELQKNRHRNRLIILLFIVFLGIGTLLSRLHNSQIEDLEENRSRIPGNRTVTIREPGVRGIIMDRTGKVILADNLRDYEVSLNLEEIRKAWFTQTRKQINSSTDSEEKKALKKKIDTYDIVDIVNELIRPKLKEYKIEQGYNTTALRTHYVTHRGLIPFRYPARLSYTEFSKLAENNLEMPGVHVNVRPRRIYPYGTLACHILGRTHGWKKGSIPLQEKKFNYDHYIGDDYGESGIELTLNDELVGTPGVKTILKNEKGHVLGIQSEVQAGQGAAIRLTIDARLQYTVENILRKAGRAAAIVLDPRNGDILAMASLPNYNPNEFIPSISRKKWDVYNTNRARPFINRCISAYMPASTFKLSVALTGCLEGLGDHRHNCTGKLTYGKNFHAIHCHRRSGHGDIKLASAVKASCNPYFMSMANRIGPKKLSQSFENLGLGKKTGIRLPNEASGIVPGSRIWKTEIRLNEPMTPALTAMTSIGQFDSKATPLQIAALTATIANGGYYYQPKIIKEINHPLRGTTIEQPKLLLDLTAQGLNPKDLETIRKGLYLAANEAGGTASRAALKNVIVAAKTGTAQVGGKSKRDHHAWTTAFAPYDNPRYVVTVLVESGKSGGKVASPLVHLILRAIFSYETEEGSFKLPLARLGYDAGHFDPIDEIGLPEEDLLPLALDPLQNEGETGNEAAELHDENDDEAVLITPNRIPLPSFTPLPDSD